MAKRLYNKQNRKELKKIYSSTDEERKVISFYKYIQIEHPAVFRNRLYESLDSIRLKGRIYVAHEGINAQVSIPADKVETFKELINAFDELKDIRLNIAVEHQSKSFFALVIKVREKIVADGIDDPSFNVTHSGIHLDAASFNQLAIDPNTIIVDMRNHYESEVGHFKNALLPEGVTFRESLPAVKEELSDKKDKPVIMYCTGGIRCEKASAYLLHHGFEKVYQLDGGIIKYTHDVKHLGLPNLFIGKNFVFDERLGERISDDVIARCHQCDTPADDHTNCANDACHILFIQCPSCKIEFNGCCSQKCADFIRLSKEEQMILRKTESFNGSKFSKGRYRAHKPGTYRPESHKPGDYQSDVTKEVPGKVLNFK